MKAPAARLVSRFFAPVEISPGAEIKLPERSARHCVVLRLRRGETVILFNGEGGEFTAELTRVSRDNTHARVISRQPVERESPLAIELAQCVSSGDRMDITLQKSTELGVARIVPIASERSIVRLSSDRADRRDHRPHDLPRPGGQRRNAAASCTGCGPGSEAHGTAARGNAACRTGGRA